MKNISIIFFVFFCFSAKCQTGSYEDVYGNYNYHDSLQFSKYRNSSTADSVLKTDSLGKIYQAHLNFAPSVYTVIPGTYSYTMQSGQLLEKMEIIEPTSVNIDIGTTVGAHDISQGVPVTTGYANFSINYYANSGQILYFTGATINTIFKIYFR